MKTVERIKIAVTTKPWLKWVLIGVGVLALCSIIAYGGHKVGTGQLETLVKDRVKIIDDKYQADMKAKDAEIAIKNEEITVKKAALALSEKHYGQIVNLQAKKEVEAAQIKRPEGASETRKRFIDRGFTPSN